MDLTNRENALRLQPNAAGSNKPLGFELVAVQPVHLGTIDVPLYQDECAIAIGSGAGYYRQGECAITIGHEAGHTQQGDYAVAVGARAGELFQKSNAIALGYEAANVQQGAYGIALGYQAAEAYQLDHAVAIGVQAGQLNQGTGSVALGLQAGQYNQRMHAVALGTGAGRTGQGTYAVAIGYHAGQTNQPTKSIVLNASGTALTTVTQSEACYVAPVRSATGSNVLYYDPTSKEVTYGAGGGGGGLPNGITSSNYLYYNGAEWAVGSSTIRLGEGAAFTSQGANAVAIGAFAGHSNQGAHAIAIGYEAGKTDQPASSIVLNASGTALTTVTRSNAFYVNPIFNSTAPSALYYDSTSKEITHTLTATTPAPYYMDFLNTQMYSTAQVGDQVTNAMFSGVIPTIPTAPAITVPSTFNFSVGTGGDFPDLQTALASVSVTNGMNLRMIAGTYTIPDTTGITISKQVGIYAVDGVVVLQTTNTASAPTNAITISAPNVKLYGLTIRQQTTNYNNNEVAVLVTGGVANVVIAFCRIEHTEFGIYIDGSSFQISNCTIAYIGLTNSTRRCIGIAGTSGNSFITQNTWVNNAASGNLRAIGLINGTVYTGNLVIQGNVQDANSTLQQFFINEGVYDAGTNVFSLWVDGNDTNETSAFVVFTYSTANVGASIDKIVLTNNSCSNNHSGGGKGIIAIDNNSGAAAFRATALPVYSSRNVVRNNAWRVDFVLATGSSGNLVGRRTTVPSAGGTVRSFYGNGLAVVSDTTLTPGTLTPGSYALGFYVSLVNGVGRLTYRFGYTNSLGYGSAFNVVQTGVVDNITSSAMTLVNAFLLIPYAAFTAGTSRLRLEIAAENLAGSDPILVYSRTGANGTYSMVYKLVGYAL